MDDSATSAQRRGFCFFDLNTGRTWIFDDDAPSDIAERRIEASPSETRRAAFDPNQVPEPTELALDSAAIQMLCSHSAAAASIAASPSRT